MDILDSLTTSTSATTRLLFGEIGLIVSVLGRGAIAQKWPKWFDIYEIGIFGAITFVLVIVTALQVPPSADLVIGLAGREFYIFIRRRGQWISERVGDGLLGPLAGGIANAPVEKKDTQAVEELHDDK